MPLRRKANAAPFAAVLLIVTASHPLFGGSKISEEKRCPMKGQMVDVGGHKLHLYCAGSGSPVIILAAGGLDSLLQWEPVQPQIAAFTRVCSFDAPGYGWSERAKAVSFKQTAIDLHTALFNAKVDSPYVLVGHSNGGLVAQAFIHLYRDEVVGAVFDDSVNAKESLQ